MNLRRRDIDIALKYCLVDCPRFLSGEVSKWTDEGSAQRQIHRENVGKHRYLIWTMTVETMPLSTF